MRATSIGLAMVAAGVILAAGTSSWAQCTRVLNSECTSSSSPEYNSYRCSQQRACDEKSSSSNVMTYGAIAYSRSTHGYGWDFGLSRAVAEQRALKQCRSVLRDMGVDEDDCDATNTAFWGSYCGSLAQSDNGAYSIMTGATSAEANEKALSACKGHGGVDCKVADKMPQCAN